MRIQLQKMKTAVKSRFIPSLEERHFTDPILPGLEAYTKSLYVLQLTTTNLEAHSPVLKAMSDLVISIGTDKIIHSAIPKVQHQFREIYQSFSQRMVLDSSPIGQLHAHYSQANAALMVADWMKDAASPQLNASKGADAAAKAEARRAANALKKANAARNKLAAAALLKDVGKDEGAPANQPVVPVSSRSCSWYNSASGCKSGSACVRAHTVPGRSTGGWKYLSEFFKERYILPSKGFLAAP